MLQSGGHEVRPVPAGNQHALRRSHNRRGLLQHLLAGQQWRVRGWGSGAVSMVFSLLCIWNRLRRLQTTDFVLQHLRRVPILRVILRSNGVKRRLRRWRTRCCCFRLFTWNRLRRLWPTEQVPVPVRRLGCVATPSTTQGGMRFGRSSRRQLRQLSRVALLCRLLLCVLQARRQALCAVQAQYDALRCGDQLLLSGRSRMGRSASPATSSTA
jgi:hypothetical protein